MTRQYEICRVLEIKRKKKQKRQRNTKGQGQIKLKPHKLRVVKRALLRRFFNPVKVFMMYL